MHHTFLFISLPSLYDFDVKLTSFTFYGQPADIQRNDNLSFSFSTWISLFRIQPQESSPTLDNASWDNRAEFSERRIHFLSRDVFASAAIVVSYTFLFLL